MCYKAMNPFCICESCAFCFSCTHELGKWENQECHICKYYVFIEDFHLKMSDVERKKAYDEWNNACRKLDGCNDL